jgi:nitroreductase
VSTGKEKLLSEIVRERRSTPSFAGLPVHEADLQAIVEAGLEAPSGYNLQPWRFVVVRDAELRRQLRAACHNQAKVKQAPVTIVACGDPQGWSGGDLDEMLRIGREHGFDSTQDERTRQNVSGYLGSHPNIEVWLNRQVMIATTSMMLMAEALGYDTALMEGFKETEVREILEIPQRMCVVCLLALGRRSGNDKPHGGRFAASRLVFGDRFGSPFEPV